MPRFHLLLAMGVLLVALVGLGFRWLWGQRGSLPMTLARRTSRVVVFVGCLLLSTLLAGGLQLLWHERPNQPATAEDLRILEKADALLKDESAWNRDDDKLCDDDKASGKWSLYCAVATASIEVLGTYDHTRVALQEVRFAVEEASPAGNSRDASWASTTCRRRVLTTSSACCERPGREWRRGSSSPGDEGVFLSSHRLVVPPEGKGQP